MSNAVNSSLKTVVKGTTAVFLGSVAGFILWFVIKLLIVRNITLEEFGLFSLAIAAVSVLSEVSLLGIQSGSARFISIHLGEGNREEADIVAKNSLNLVLISSMTFFAILFLFSGFIANNIFYKPEFEAPLRAISFFIPVSALSQIAASILRGHNIVTSKVYYLDVGFPLFFILMLGIVFALDLPYIGVVYAYMCAMVVVLISIGFYGYRKIGLNPIVLRGRRGRLKLLIFSLPLLAGSIWSIVLNWADTLILGRYSSAELIGIYNISITFARFLLFPLLAVDFVFMPVIGAMYAKNQKVEIRRAYQVITKWVFSASLPIFFLLFFFPEPIIIMLFGERFVDSALPLRILSFGFMFHVFLGSVTVLVIVFGMVKELMIIASFGCVLDILLNYFLIKHMGYGAIGASVASASSYISVTAVGMMLIYRKTGLHPFVRSYLSSYAGSAAVAIAIFALSKVLSFHWWMLPFYFLFFLCGLLASVHFTGSIDKEDIDMINAISERTGLEMKSLRKLFRRFIR